MFTRTAPIRELLKKEVEFQWQVEQQTALNKIKDILTRKPVLKFYDSSKKLTTQANASSTGLGTCLMQDGQPIAYASCALRDPEKKWFQIERELLAIVFTTERFH